MKLKKLTVNSFGGISPSSPVLIDFTQSKWVEALGDNGANKTSLLNAFLVGCGQLSKENKDFVNLESNKIDINFDFVGNDRLEYTVRVTKSSIQLLYAGESLPEPINKLKELLGVIGVSPMEVKNKSLKEIVKWLSGYSNKSAEEFESQMLKHKNNMKAARDSRAMANKNAKALNEYLNNEDLYINWEDSESKYIKAVDVKDLSAKLDAAGRKSDKFVEAESKLKQLNERKNSIDEQIARLMKEVQEIDKSIAIGTKYVEDNRGVKKEYDVVKKEYDNAAAESVQFNKWQEVKRKSKEKEDFETLSQKADSQEKEILQSVKELQAEILPDLKDMSLVTEDTHENGQMVKEGLYYKGKNVAQLSQSEWWAIVLMIWKKYKVKIIVIDNFSELGTMAVDMLTQLSKQGAYIFTAEMARGQKELTIEYK